MRRSDHAHIANLLTTHESKNEIHLIMQSGFRVHEVYNAREVRAAGNAHAFQLAQSFGRCQSVAETGHGQSAMAIREKLAALLFLSRNGYRIEKIVASVGRSWCLPAQVWPRRLAMYALT